MQIRELEKCCCFNPLSLIKMVWYIAIESWSMGESLLFLIGEWQLIKCRQTDWLMERENHSGHRDSSGWFRSLRVVARGLMRNSTLAISPHKILIIEKKHGVFRVEKPAATNMTMWSRLTFQWEDRLVSCALGCEVLRRAWQYFWGIPAKKMWPESSPEETHVGHPTKCKTGSF